MVSARRCDPGAGRRVAPSPRDTRTDRGCATLLSHEVSTREPDKPLTWRSLTLGKSTPPGADEQPRGADQPDVPVLGEGAKQVASPPDAGAVRGAEARRGVE